MRATPASLGPARAVPSEITMEAFLDDIFSDDGVVIEDNDDMSTEDSGYMPIQDFSVCDDDFTEKLKQEFVDFTRENHDTIVEYATKVATAISFGIALWNVLSNEPRGQKRSRDSDDEPDACNEACKKQKLA